MKRILSIIIDTPWKFTNELAMYLLKPFALIYLKFFCGVQIGSGSKFYGLPRIYRHKESQIIIGNNFECRNWWFSNPLGINHPTIIATWQKGAVINIGDDVGISGGSIVAFKKISIGDRVLIGANSTIIDSDFHPTTKGNKRYSTDGVGVKEVNIGKDAFLGMNSLILKGSVVSKDQVVPAGAVFRIKS